VGFYAMKDRHRRWIARETTMSTGIVGCLQPQEGWAVLQKSNGAGNIKKTGVKKAGSTNMLWGRTERMGSTVPTCVSYRYIME